MLPSRYEFGADGCNLNWGWGDDSKTVDSWLVSRTDELLGRCSKSTSAARQCNSGED